MRYTYRYILLWLILSFCLLTQAKGNEGIEFTWSEVMHTSGDTIHAPKVILYYPYCSGEGIMYPDGIELRGSESFYPAHGDEYEIGINIRAFAAEEQRRLSNVIEEMDFYFELGTTWFRGLVSLNIGEDTFWTLRDIPVYSLRRGFGESAVYRYPELITLVTYRGHSYIIDISCPDTVPERLIPDAVSKVDWICRKLLTSLIEHYRVSYTGGRANDSNKPIRDFLHARPFWMHPADTMCWYLTTDGYRFSQFEVSPYFTQGQTVKGDRSVKEGAVYYRYNFLRYDKWDEYNIDRSGQQGVTVAWWPLPRDEVGNLIPYAPWDSLVDDRECTREQPVWDKYGDGRYRITDGVYPFRLSEEDTVSVSLASFKECRAHRLTKKFSYHDYEDDRDYFAYRTMVYFTRDGIQFLINSWSINNPRFDNPSDEWWQWFENHWYWAEDKEPAWSRYPIPLDDIWYPDMDLPYFNE